MSFQAETRKLLDIVTNSIYTDKEVFLRELISNSSDALEKYRYYQVKGEVKGDADTHPLEIQILTDSVNNTLTIMDSGVGMTKDELVANLGTIARSGSKQFVESLKGSAGSGEQGSSTPSSANSDGIIGQFGVGFYSSFMVSDSVSFESRSAVAPDEVAPHKWSSDGSGVFKIEPLTAIDGLHRHGSKITMKLKDSCKEFSDADRIKSIIKHYSSFVSFPIKVNGDTVNTVSAIWTQDKKTVTEEQYLDFYRFIANAYDKPKYHLHFRTDAPIDLKVLLFVPSFHSEKFGMGVTEPGVNLYSRKVLIESKPKDLLPDWLR
jgi:HSP90 family molecular chaperone